jgi:hypothetical protein
MPIPRFLPASSSRRAPFARLLAALALGSLGLVACAGGASTSSSSTSYGEGGSGGRGAGGHGTGAGGAGGAGGATATASGGAGGGPECTKSSDCTKDPKRPVCDTSVFACVPCTLGEDVCPKGQLCVQGDKCQVGCSDASDCKAAQVCDPASHLCVNCDKDADCNAGSICVGNTCIPGCSAAQPCQAGDLTCCSSTCVDLTTDLLSCGQCGRSCAAPPHGKPECVGGTCGLRSCLDPWADCDGDPSNGCEVDTLADGACVCTPGDTTPCYDGAPGTEGIGVCKGGLRTCDASGTKWGDCQGEVLPQPERCNGLDDDCDGSPEAPGCVDCKPNTGTCNGNVGTTCRDDGLALVTETCDALQGTTCNPQTGRCDGPCGKTALGASYIGCDYFPTVTANLVNAAKFSFAVAVSNTSALVATVTVTQGANVLQTVTVPAGAVKTITLPWNAALKGPSSNNVLPMPGSVLSAKGAYRLRATQPVTVYQFNPLDYKVGDCAADLTNCSYSNDASILLPTTAWTGTYRVAARHHFGGASGFYAVTARDDGTKVTVAPGPGGGLVKAGVAGVAADGTGTVTLNSGDVMEIVTNGGVSQSDPNDVTGTLVTADKPVQVIAGHQCTYIPDNVGYCDHLEETMFPFETLSTEYIVTDAFIPQGNNPPIPKVEMVRIVATADNTSLSYDPPKAGAPATIAKAGGWVEIANDSGDFVVIASAPVLVAQYMEGQAAGGNTGDPSESVAVPKAQYRTSYLFHAPTNYEANFVNVVAPGGASVMLDGAAVGGFVPIGNSGFSVARVVLSNAGTGDHAITGSAPFGISVYGYGQYTSYWYPGGSNLVRLHD